MRSRSLTAVAASLFLCAAAPAAFAAPLGEPFATVSGTCTEQDPFVEFTGEPVSSRHPDMVVRYEITGGQGSVGIRDVRGGDAVWDTRPGLEVNDLPRVSADCYETTEDMKVVARFYDQPSTPAAFSGTGGGSGIAFTTPGETEYVADVRVSSGRIEIEHGSRVQRFGVGDSQFALGRLYKGSRSLEIEPVDGTRPGWTITIRALPTTLTDVAFGSPFINNDVYTWSRLRLTRSGDMTLDAVVTDASGRGVRRLLERDREFSWDGTDETGRPVPDGPYLATVNGLDPAGYRSSGTANIVVDSTDPVLTVLSRRTLLERESVVVAFGDATSGIESSKITTVADDGRAVLSDGLMSIRPARGWAPGTNIVYAEAEDRAGNDVSLRYEVDVVKERGCTKATARRAALASNPTVAALRRAGIADRKTIKAVRVAQVVCADLDGDGPQEMAALLRGKGKRTAVVVFSMSETDWKLRFRTGEHVVTRLALRSGALVLRRAAKRAALTLRPERAGFRLGGAAAS